MADTARRIALLAAGCRDLVPETGLETHDFLPIIVVIEEVGGVMTDRRGAALTMECPGDVPASTTLEPDAAMLGYLAPIAQSISDAA